MRRTVSDPLTLLREYTSNDKTIRVEGGFAFFDNVSYSISTETAFRSGTGFYNLDQVMTYAKNSKLKSSEYVSECHKRSIQPIAAVDRGELLKFLEGKIQESSKIDQTKKLESIQHAHVQEIPQISSPVSHRSSQVTIKPALETCMTSLISEGVTGQMFTESYARSVNNNIPIIVSLSESLGSYRNNLKRKNLDVVTSFKSIHDTFEREYIEKEAPLTRCIRSRLLSANTSVDDDGGCLISRMPSVDFSFAMKRYTDLVQKPRDAEYRKTSSSSGSSSSSSSRWSRPILLLPSGQTSALLTLDNIRAFLDEGRFVSMEELKSSSSSSLLNQDVAKESRVTVKRLLYNRQFDFTCIDSTQKLSSFEWSQVVAVFCLGPQWQFSGFKWQQPVDLFTNVLGLYVNYDSSPDHANMSQWNVRRFKVSSNRRHLDTGVANEVWSAIEEFMICHDE